MPKPVRRVSEVQRRDARFVKLLSMLASPPEEWLKYDNKVLEGLEPIPCKTYEELVGYWKKAMHWTPELDLALSVMLAVSASTKLPGDQLWLRVIGPPGSGKTRLCDAMSTCRKYCYPLGQQRGFHSGWKGGDGEDYSLLARANNKTLITPEGDELLRSPMLGEIQAQGRRIYDGTATASYRNIKHDKHYTGLRMTWIIAGTSSLRQLNRSNLGDRFIDCVIERPNKTVEREILKRVAKSAWAALMADSSQKEEDQLSPELAMAYRKTGGYVLHLSDNIDNLLSPKVMSLPEEYEDRCTFLGEFTGNLRARPDSDLPEEEHPEVELSTRLTSQYIRLAGCLAAILNKQSVDEEVMKRVAKVAHDTCRGVTLEIVKLIALEGRSLGVGTIANRIKKTNPTVHKHLHFLKAIGMVNPDKKVTKKGVTGTQSNRWRLTSEAEEILRGIGEL